MVGSNSDRLLDSAEAPAGIGVDRVVIDADTGEELNQAYAAVSVNSTVVGGSVWMSRCWVTSPAGIGAGRRVHATAGITGTASAYGRMGGVGVLRVPLVVGGVRGWRSLRWWSGRRGP